MKQFLLFLPILALFSCQETTSSEQTEKPKDYVVFSGKIAHTTADSLAILSRDFAKTIAIKEDGSFTDTFSVEPGTYYFTTRQKGMIVFLKDGYDLSLDVDAEDFAETAKFTGEGAKENNYLVAKARFETELYDQNLTHLDSTQLDSATQVLVDQAKDYINSQKDIDSILIHENLNELSIIAQSLKEYHLEIIRLKNEMPKGSSSPIFTDFENYDGSKTSLSDLKGKNVYIDVWATWCGPCKAEIPALKKLEHDYEGKNIAFVSLSIDDAQAHQGSWEVANQKWRAMVKDKELGGIQLLAPKGWEDPFIRAYKINSIPRFILLDTEGNIVSASAPRPSDESLRTLFDEII